MSRRIQSIITAGVVAGGFSLLAVLERKRPLRRRTEPPAPRFARNLTLGAIAALVWRRPQPAVSRHGVAESVADILLLDYTLWWWHRWNHECPPLWYFHSLHHRDADLDVSTAVRFHLGERLLASVHRSLQIRLIRPSEFSIWLWETLLFASILFHHSNVRLPVTAESRIVRWLVTPRMHGIHHSNLRQQSETNYAALLTWWDVVHDKLLLDVPQDAITIGEPGGKDEG